MAFSKQKEETKMEYQLIASDLDGTLLDNNGCVSDENWAAIETLQKLGVWFVPATGRAFEAMPTELKENPLIRYYITSNGAMVYDKERGKSYDLALPRQLATQVLDKLYSYPVCVMLHAENRSCVEQSTHNTAYYESYNLNRMWQKYVLEKETPVPELKKLAYNAPIVESITVFFKNMEDLLECKAFFQKDERLQVAQTDPHNMEICASRAGKGKALRLLAEKLSVPVEATIAVGDSTNDLTMITAAGLGLAMANAVPEVKVAADGVICANQEHGIRYILEHYIHR